MRIGVDATPAISGVTGVARYTLALLDGLPRAGVEVSSFAIGRGPGSLPAGTRHLRVPLRVVHRAWQLGVPLRAEHLCGRVDVVHSTDLVLPPTRLPSVATVHDVSAVEIPDLHSARIVRLTAARLASLRRATVVVANSQASADALSRVVDIASLVVVPLAPCPLPDPGDGPPVVSGDYVLCVGEVAERKDHVTLVRAFAEADLGPTRLVIAGPAGSGSALLAAEIERLGLAERVLVLGRVDDLTLARLYAGARAMCLASRQEGFCLPLVEAMQRDLPIVVTDLPVTREVTAGAAVLVAARDVDGFARSLERVVSDEDLRKTLIDASRRRADAFSPERMVQGTVAAYERALAIS